MCLIEELNRATEEIHVHKSSTGQLVRLREWCVKNNVGAVGDEVVDAVIEEILYLQLLLRKAFHEQPTKSDAKQFSFKVKEKYKCLREAFDD